MTGQHKASVCECHSCPDYQSVEELWAQQQYDPALACSVQRAALRLQQGHGRPEGQHGLQHIFLRSLENDKRNNIFS